MNRRVLIVSGLIAGVVFAFADDKPPRPAKDVLADAQKQAKVEKKNIFLVFGASW